MERLNDLPLQGQIGVDLARRSRVVGRLAEAPSPRRLSIGA